MRLITEAGDLATVAERWKAQYWYPKTGWSESLGSSPSREAIYAALLAPNLTRAQVAGIIGNDCWICSNDCSEPGCEAPAVIMLGEEPDYESITAYLCADHLKSALALVEASVQPS